MKSTLLCRICALEFVIGELVKQMKHGEAKSSGGGNQTWKEKFQELTSDFGSFEVSNSLQDYYEHSGLSPEDAEDRIRHL